MDAYSPTMLAQGLRGMIGKGRRNNDVKEAMKQYKGVYFGAIGGQAQLLPHVSNHVKSLLMKILVLKQYVV